MGTDKLPRGMVSRTVHRKPAPRQPDPKHFADLEIKMRAVHPAVVTDRTDLLPPPDDFANAHQPLPQDTVERFHVADSAPSWKAWQTMITPPQPFPASRDSTTTPSAMAQTAAPIPASPPAAGYHDSPGRLFGTNPRTTRNPSTCGRPTGKSNPSATTINLSPSSGPLFSETRSLPLAAIATIQGDRKIVNIKKVSLILIQIWPLYQRAGFLRPPNLTRCR